MSNIGAIPIESHITTVKWQTSKKMIIVPEKTFKDLQDAKTNSHTISPDIFDGDIDSKLIFANIQYKPKCLEILF